MIGTKINKKLLSQGSSKRLAYTSWVAGFFLGFASLVVAQERAADKTPQLIPTVKQSSNSFGSATHGVKSTEEFKKITLPFIETHCLDCHSGSGSEGNFDLEKFRTFADVESDLESWGRVRNVLRRKEMPPAEMDQPTVEEVDKLQQWILKTVEHSSNGVEFPGRVRRLTRIEFENTINELFRLERDCFNNKQRVVRTADYYNPASGKMPRHVFAVSHSFTAHGLHTELADVASLADDPPVEYGFANEQESLSISPLQMEKYFEIAAGILNSESLPLISPIWNHIFETPDGLPVSEQLKQGERVIGNFLPRAFRRDVTAAEVSRYVTLFEREFSKSNDYSSSMKTTISAILVSPNFLFRTEFQKPLSSEVKSDRDTVTQSFGVANRLSYFLWASMPDDQLLQAAREGQLTSRLRIKQQVDRMLNDRRSKSLSFDFAMQWLKVRKAGAAFPDQDKFKKYYEMGFPPPATSMMIEQMLLFESVLVEDRSIFDLIDPDYGYLNRQLMNWYQVNPKKALGFTPEFESYEDFYRIKWDTRHRGGIISSGATLVGNSTTTRTSPVYRGAWILEVIFNAPPPPAPGDVPPLEEVGTDSETKVHANIRERLKEHRENPACASCHDRIDPFGFSLELFDSVGRWRQKYENGENVDCRGRAMGFEFNGPIHLKFQIQREKSLFVQAFVEHLLKYALGRPLNVHDMPEVNRITAKAIADGCRIRGIIRDVCLSQMFLE